MKQFVASVAVVLVSVLVPLPLAKSQDNAAEIKNILLAPLNGVRGGGRAAAVNIERGARYPSVIHLKGKVESERTDLFCVPTKRTTTKKPAK